MALTFSGIVNQQQHGLGMKKGLLPGCAASAWFRRIMCLIFWVTVVMPPAHAVAHPHVFIVQRFNIAFDDKGMAGVNVWWKFDDMFASMIAGDHDVNGNGSLEADEVASIKEKAFSLISAYNYFIFIKIDGKPFDIQYITDFNAILEDSRLIYEFFIPCHVTATRHQKRISVSGYDPTYYSAIFFAADKPVSLDNAGAFDVNTAIREDPDTEIYYGMVHPWTLFMELRTRS